MGRQAPSHAPRQASAHDPAIGATPHSAGSVPQRLGHLRLLPGYGASVVCEASPPLSQGPGYAQSQAARLAPVQLISGLPVRAIIDQVRHIQRMGDISQRALAFYIAELVDRTGWKELGSPTLEHFARKQLDMDRRRVGELRAVGLMLRDHPAIDDTFRQRGIAWCKLVVLARVVSPAHELAWLARAVDHDLESLKRAVRNSKPGGPPPKAGKGKGLPEVRYPLRVVHDAVTKRLWEQAREALAEELGAPVTDCDAHRILAEHYLGGGGTSRPVYRIELKQHCVHEDCPSHLSVDTADGPVPAATLDAPDRKTPPWMRALVLERDGVMCRNCGNRQRLQAHHVIFRADGGPTQLSNLATLCCSCHALLHAGHLVAQGDHGATCRFEAPDAEALRAAAEASQRAVILEPTPPPVPQPEPLTLEEMPARVRGDWWARCSDALRTGEGGRIDLVRGFVPPTDGELPSSHLPKLRRDGSPEDRACMTSAFEGLRGRDRLVDRLQAWAKTAEKDHAPFPHALFVGPAGTGKTTLARAVTARMGVHLTTAMGNRGGDPTTLLGLLAGLREGDALFLDEIHSLPRKVMELLYEAMTDQQVTLTVNQGARSREIVLELPRFTLLAATTEEMEIPDALRSRFQVVERLTLMTPEELAEIAMDHATRWGFALRPKGALLIARVAAGSPRKVGALVQAIRAQVVGHEDADRPIGRRAVLAALKRLDLDETGLDPEHRRYLDELAAARGPVTLCRISAYLGLPEAAVRKRIEPLLFKLGLVDVGTRGRVLVT